MPAKKKIPFDPKKHKRWRASVHIGRRKKPPNLVGLLAKGELVRTRGGKGRTRKLEIVPVNVFALSDKRAGRIKDEQQLATHGLIGTPGKGDLIELWADRRKRVHDYRKKTGKKRKVGKK